MGKIIKFPFSKTAAPLAALEESYELPPPQILQMEQVLRALLGAIRHGTIEPERMFLVFEQGDVCSYLNLEFKPDQLVQAVDKVLQDIARGYDDD